MFFLFLLILNGCAYKTEITAVPSRDQVTDHKGFVTSELKHAVSISRYYNFEMLKVVGRYKPMFMIIIENCGGKPIHISRNNISVLFEGNSKEWASKKMDLLSASDILHIQMAGFFGEQVKAAHKNSATRAESLDTTMKKLESEVSASRQAQRQYSIPKIILEHEKIMPGKSITAIFLFDIEKMGDRLEGNFTITVSIDGEDHVFTFRRRLI